MGSTFIFVPARDRPVWSTAPLCARMVSPSRDRADRLHIFADSSDPSEPEPVLRSERGCKSPRVFRVGEECHLSCCATAHPSGRACVATATTADRTREVPDTGAPEDELL